MSQEKPGSPNERQFRATNTLAVLPLLAHSGHQRGVSGCLLLGGEQTWTQAEPSNINAGLPFKASLEQTRSAPQNERHPVE
jgi:hypothetical protein